MKCPLVVRGFTPPEGFLVNSPSVEIAAGFPYFTVSRFESPRIWEFLIRRFFCPV